MRHEEKQSDFLIHLTTRTFDPSQEPVVDPSDKPENYIVQFRKSLTGNEREHLRRKYKVSLKHYVPNLAFLERLDSRTLAALSEDPLHRTSALYQWNDKISPNIGEHEPRSPERRRLNGVLIRVLLFSDVKEGEISKVVEDIEKLRGPMEHRDVEGDQGETQEGLSKNGKAKDLSAIKFHPNEMRRLDDRKQGGRVQLVFVLPSLDLLPIIAKIDKVQWIEEVVESVPDRVDILPDVRPNTVAGTIQAGDPASTPVWDRNIDGCGQAIGIIDHTFVDQLHCMFVDDTGAPIGPSHRKLIGFRTFYDTLDNDHGTSVAGIAVGDESQNSGYNLHRGIAWHAKLSYDDQKSIFEVSRTMFAVLDECEDEVMIHSNSWHDHTIRYIQTNFDVDNFVWLNEDHFVCGSTANSGELLGPPGTAKNAVCVSASLEYPNHLLHGDGEAGPTLDNRLKPDLCAPGVGMEVADADSGCGTRTIPVAATSFATPVIAGAAALVRQYYLSGFHYAGVQDLAYRLNPSAALIKATLLNSTVPMENVYDYPNNTTGWGLVKLDNTLYFEGSPRKLFVKDVRNSDGLCSEESHEHQITVGDYALPLKITLVWTDPPSELDATGITLINNLNLVVTSPDGNSTYLGNISFNQGFSQPVDPYTARDYLNNVEMVVIEDPAPGDWTITVEAERVNIEKQGYALVVTGSLI